MLKICGSLRGCLRRLRGLHDSYCVLLKQTGRAYSSCTQPAISTSLNALYFSHNFINFGFRRMVWFELCKLYPEQVRKL